MPTVPLLSPDVAPSAAGTPEVNMAVPVEAFGGAVGHAMSGLGEAGAQAGDRIWQRAVEIQNLENDTQAKAADTQYMIKAGELHAQFSSLEGTAAKAAFPKYMADLQQAREDVRKGLNNPMQQKMYDASSINFMGRSIFNGAGHAAQQQKVAASNASQARVDTISDSIGENPSDENGFQRGVRAIQAETRQQGHMHGWSPEQTDQTISANVSTAVAKRIVGLSRTDPFAAQTMFDTATKGGNLTPNDASRVQASIQTQARQAIPRGISSEVNADLDHPAPEGVPEKSLEDRIAEAEIKAEPFAKNDPLLKDFVKQRVIADYNRSKAVQRDADQRNEQVVAGALMSGNKEGILPKSVDELRLINPEVGAAWDSLKPTIQRKYMAAMAQNAKGERVAWTDDSLRNYQTLKGMAVDSPVEFLAKDVIAEKMPTSAKRELINLQTRLRAQSESDPRVARALSILIPDGIVPDKKVDQESYYHYVGSLADALDAYQTDNKKVPPADEVKKIGARLAQEQHTHWWQSSQKFVDQDIPDEDMTRLRDDPYWKSNGITPNDNMLRRIYIANKYNELYRGKGKSKPEAAFPPQAGNE